MYEKFLPKFKVVELNLSTAHLIGHVIAQTPAYVKANDISTITSSDVIASVDKGDYKYVENGVIVGLDQKGILCNYDATKHAQPCLVYQDELITGPFDTLNQFAQPVESIGSGKYAPVYVRALPLYLNDTFTTDNFTGELQDGFAKVTNGILEITASYEAGKSMFIVKKTTMPNREPGAEFTYIGAVAAGAKE